jgi:hypothetical protein
MPSSNTSQDPQTTTKHRKTRVIRSRGDTNGFEAKKVKYIYRVRVEAPVDLVWAFYAITDAGYSYTPKCSADGQIIFSTKCSIDELRFLWDDLKKDLHVMIETLDYVDDYTGERYFTKYMDYNDDKNSVDYYCSEEEDEIPVYQSLQSIMDARPQGISDGSTITRRIPLGDEPIINT